MYVAWHTQTGESVDVGDGCISDVRIKGFDVVHRDYDDVVIAGQHLSDIVKNGSHISG